MKKLSTTLFVFFLGISMNSLSQNKPILYGFDEIPQTLLLNPGATTNYKFHIGIPLLSSISLQVGVTGVTIAKLFRNDGVNFTLKYKNALTKLTANDYIQSYIQTEILYGGYRLNEKNYLTAGFYMEADLYATIPKDILMLISEGNATYLNRSFSIGQVNVKAEMVGVLHFGLSRKINTKLTVGTRLKIYSGVMNVTTANNSGTFTTNLGKNNIYTHYLNNAQMVGYTSGIYDQNNESNINVSELLGRTFLGANLGIGFDIGATYKITTQTKITASILDVGFVSYSKNIRNGRIQGSYVFSGIQFQYNTNTNYWENLNRDFDKKVSKSENKESYLVMRPLKLNTSIKHSWGKSRKEQTCYDITYNTYFDNSIGAQLFSVFRPSGPKIAVTGFYERRLFERITSKITYTVDDFSYSNLGVGLSAKIGKVNVYGMVDNLLKLTDIAASNTASFQFGINLISN